MIADPNGKNKPLPTRSGNCGPLGLSWVNDPDNGTTRFCLIDPGTGEVHLGTLPTPYFLETLGHLQGPIAVGYLQP